MRRQARRRVVPRSPGGDVAAASGSDRAVFRFSTFRRLGLVVIAVRGAQATKQSSLLVWQCSGLLRYARNDGEGARKTALPHYGALNRRAPQRGIDHLGQCFELKRLLQRGAVAVFLWKTRRAIASGEDERAVAGLDQFG